MWRRLRRNLASSSAELDPHVELAEVIEANRSRPNCQAERRALELRHLSGIELAQGAVVGARHPQPDARRLPEGDPLPEFTPDDLTPGLIRAGILRDGCVLVRGLVRRDEAQRFALEIDRSFSERERLGVSGSCEEAYYEEFVPNPGYNVAVRPWVQAGGGVLAADAPRLAFEMFEMFERAGLPELVARYLGEPALISVHKTTLRKAEPSVAGAWHQDGAFMGEVRALNLWVSLSRCGDSAPGLDIVPRRLDHIVTTGTEGASVGFAVSQEMAEAAAGDAAIARPIFEPGDALLFDELFLHQTGSDQAMPNPRYAIESWFFGASGFPADYAPLAV